MKNTFSVIIILCAVIISFISCSKNSNSPTSSSSSHNYVLDTSFLQGTWSIADSAAKYSQNVYCLAADKQGNIYLATSKGIYRSVDNGTTWSLLSDPVLGTQEFLSVTADTVNNYLYVSSDTCIYRSTNNGASWNEVYSGSFFGLTISSSETVYAISELHYGVFHSVQHGDPGTWSKSNNGIAAATGNAYYVYGLACGRNGIVYAGTDQYFYHSTDDGANWEQIGGAALSGYLFSAVGADANGDVFAAKSVQNLRPFTLSRSTDDGANWSQSMSINDNYGVFSSVMVTKGCVFACTHSDVFVSFDSGITWDTLDTGISGNATLGGQIAQIFLLPNGTLFLNISSTIYKLDRPIFKAS